jgi:hypothetical protein
MPACSPYAVFRAEDWLPAPMPIDTLPATARSRGVPPLAKPAGTGARWTTLVQGDLFQPLLFD